MPETEMLIGGSGALPILSSVRVGNGPYIVLVDWAEGSRSGTTEAIDLAPVILTYKVFKSLRDDAALFATVRLSEHGDAIEWGPDDGLAISGQTLERLAEEVMTSAQFTDFMKRNKLTLDATAAQLGISRRMAAYYAKERAVPRYIALACKFVELALNAPRPAVAGVPSTSMPSEASGHETRHLTRLVQSALEGATVKLTAAPDRFLVSDQCQVRFTIADAVGADASPDLAATGWPSNWLSPSITPYGSTRYKKE